MCLRSGGLAVSQIRTRPHFLTHRLRDSTHLYTARCSYPPFVLQHTSAHSQMFLPTVCVKHTSAHSQMFLATACVTAHICTQPDVLTHRLCYSTHLHIVRCSYPPFVLSTHLHTARCSYAPFVLQHTSAHSQMFLPTLCVTAHICTQPDVLIRGSASHVPGTIGTRSILQTAINAFIDQLTNDPNRGTVPVLQDRLFGGRSQQRIARQIQSNNII